MCERENDGCPSMCLLTGKLATTATPGWFPRPPPNLKTAIQPVILWIITPAHSDMGDD